VKGHDFSRVIKHYRMARASAPVAFLLLKWKSFESRRERLGSLTGHNFKTTRKNPTPKTRRRPGSPHSKKLHLPPPVSPYDSALDLLESTPLVPFWPRREHLAENSTASKRHSLKVSRKNPTPKTRRRPGSPHSKKLHLPPPARPYDSPLDLLESTPLVPFWPRREHLAENSTASKRHSLKVSRKNQPPKPSDG
jgi:hypothetical protein